MWRRHHPDPFQAKSENFEIEKWQISSDDLDTGGQLTEALNWPIISQVTTSSISLSWNSETGGSGEGHKTDQKDSEKGREGKEVLYLVQIHIPGQGWTDVYCGHENTCVCHKLKSNSHYEFRVAAVTEAGAGNWSTTLRAWTQEAPMSGQDIHKAVRYNDLESLRAMLTRNQTIVNTPNKYSNTPIMEAVLREQDECVKVLLEFGADMEMGNESGKNGLLLAAFIGNLRLCELLHSRGANIQVRDKSGCCILHAAADGGHPKIVEWAIKLGVDVNQKDTVKGWTPLFRTAALSGNVEVARALLVSGATPNERDVDGKTALMIATCNNFLTVVQEMVKWGADTTLTNEANKTAYDMAVALGKRNVASFLANHPH